MTGPIAVLCLLLTTGTLAEQIIDMGNYRRESGTFTHTPSETLSAPSVISCAASCTSLQAWSSCAGFTYHNGACDLFEENYDSYTGLTPLEVAAGSEPHSYRRMPAAGEWTLTGDFL